MKSWECGRIRLGAVAWKEGGRGRLPILPILRRASADCQPGRWDSGQGWTVERARAKASIGAWPQGEMGLRHNGQGFGRGVGELMHPQLKVLRASPNLPYS